MSTPEQFLTQQHYETPRNGRGQYLMADASGQVAPRTRATTFADTLANPFSLHQWKMRIVAKGMSLRPDLVAVAASTPIEDKKTFADIVAAAFDRGGGNDAARQGTALHQFVTALATQQVTEDAVPAEMIHDVHAYFRELARVGITEDTAYMERAVYNDVYDVGGTFDRIYTMPDGSRVIGDIKTGHDLSFGEHEFAVQLALYANATIMLQPGSAEIIEPMPDVRKDFAIIVHVPQGRGEAFVERLDISAGWWAARLCAEARMWRSMKTLRTPYHPGIQNTITLKLGEHTTEMITSSPVFNPVNLDAEKLAAYCETPSNRTPEAADAIASSATFGPVTTAGYLVGSYDPAVLEESMGVAFAVPTEDDAKALVDEPAEPLIEPDVEAQELFAQLKKSKPKVQDLARRVMAHRPGTDIKLNTYAINVCKAIVRHPAWPEFRSNWQIPDPPVKPADAIKEASGAVSFAEAEENARQNLAALREPLSPQAQQIVDSIKELQSGGNPFATEAQSPQAFDEAYYLRQIAHCANKTELAALWQHAQDHDVAWTDTLNAAGLNRLYTIKSV